ncbi:MAG: hypothetical protein LW806_11000 [Planctomycetaceae bacterium]|nr:hypothetical protein [Planctomycetaceae bacterium]
MGVGLASHHAGEMDTGVRKRPLDDGTLRIEPGGDERRIRVEGIDGRELEIDVERWSEREPMQRSATGRCDPADRVAVDLDHAGRVTGDLRNPPAIRNPPRDTDDRRIER